MLPLYTMYVRYFVHLECVCLCACVLFLHPCSENCVLLASYIVGVVHYSCYEFTCTQLHMSADWTSPSPLMQPLTVYKNLHMIFTSELPTHCVVVHWMQQLRLTPVHVCFDVGMLYCKHSLMYLVRELCKRLGYTFYAA